MREPKPVTQTMSTSAARQQFSGVIGRVFRGEERIIVERGGVPVAAIVSARDLERVEAYERRREADFAVLDRIGEAFADVPAEEIEREAAKAITEVRAEMRAEREQALGVEA